MSDDELFAILSEIADEEIMVKNRASIIEVGRRIISLAANGAEPYCRIYEYDHKYFGLHRTFAPTEWNGMKPTRVVAVYAAPIASGPRYDWAVSGMKQSETGNWVMAGNKPGE